MTLSTARARNYLKNFELEKLFVEELGWDRHAATVSVAVDGQTYLLRAVAEKRGVQIFRCPPRSNGLIPDYAARRKIEKQLAKTVYEHLLIFVDQEQTTQIWQWVARRRGQPAQYREHPYHPRHQSGDSLVQKLSHIYIPLNEEEAIDLTGATHRLRDAFDRDRVTKRFYDRFKTEHTAFLKFVKGVTEQTDKEWYASLMLNRLMFVYFIQRKRFLDDEVNYLRDRLRRVQLLRGKGKFQTFYRYFLLALFHEGFAKEAPNRQLDPDLAALLGTVPYLNGGLFDVHELEDRNPKLDIPDEAFERLFAFFDDWEWHLDTQPLRNDREINPDVLGYIFEKYINQKQMGAYYTKEDITDYISRSTVIPYLCDAARKKCAIAFEPGSGLWRLLANDPDRYIYAAVRHGVVDAEGDVIPLPPTVAEGVGDVSKRGGWNRTASEPFGLPTETWREHVGRRQRCLEIREKMRRGEVHEINDLVTLNLDIRQYAEDVIVSCEGPELLRSFWQAIRGVTVLDPTCGSGAFLFAALGILEPLYEACLDRMLAFVDDAERSGGRQAAKKFEDFRAVLADVDRHPNRTYFILKSIIVRNIYGVDIMEEAVEICKLRLFLNLVAQVERVDQLEPLPDVDFNIRPGNTLVGFTTIDEIRDSHRARYPGFPLTDVEKLAVQARAFADLYARFCRKQTDPANGESAADMANAKKVLRQEQGRLAQQLDRYLAGDYTIDADDEKKVRDYSKWRKTHQPFHWFTEFYGVMDRGGFDVIVGNPPYVEYTKVRSTYAVRGFRTLTCGNLYVFVLERSFALASQSARLGLIVPLSLACTDRMRTARTLLKEGTAWMPSFDIRPSALFDGVAQRLTIVLQHVSRDIESRLNTGGYRRWSAEERENLMSLTQYVVASWDNDAYPIAKVAALAESAILSKITAPLLSAVVVDSAKPIYIHRICRYFIKALDFVPFFRDTQGNKGKSEDYKPFSFDSNQRHAILCFLNSSLFYWFWRSHGDGFHCGYGDVYRAPWLSRLSTESRERFSGLAARLMLAFKENSVRKTIRTAKGEITYQEFSPTPAKPIFDEIDILLASELHFTPEERD